MKSPQNSALWMLGCLFPLAAVTVFWSFSVSAGLVSSKWEPFDETRRGRDRFQPGAAKIEIAGEDLAKGSSLTRLTQRWLRGSSITVVSDHSHLSAYRTTIHLASGLECKLVLTRYGGSAGDPVRLRPHSKALLYREHLSPTIGRRRWPAGVSVLRK